MDRTSPDPGPAAPSWLFSSPVSDQDGAVSLFCDTPAICRPRYTSVANVSYMSGVNQGFGSISAGMAMDALSEAVKSVEDRKADYEQSIAYRDSLIRSALEAGIPYKRLQVLTGLSRERLFDIRNKG